jgi:hypothetical protein
MAHRVNVRSGSHPRPKARQSTTDQADADRLTAAVGDILKSLADVAALLPEPSGRPQTGTIGRHAPESSEPWQGAAAAVYWTIHFGARQLEDVCRADIGLPPQDPARGGSAANTDDALRAVASTAPTMTAGALNAARRRVEAWLTAIQQIPDIDLADTWVPVPRQPGSLPPTCPYCTTFSLRMAPARQVVRCFNPPCRDTDDRPPVARMENGLSGGVLVFGDGQVVHYREEAQTP